MFTGIIEGVGEVRSLKKKDTGAEVEIACDFDLERTNVGDSIAVNGCCLTVVSRLGKCFWADLSSETLARTTLGKVARGTPVNLERALQVGGRLGGHLVQGHIDAIGKVFDIVGQVGPREYTIQFSHNLSKYVVEKGSVAVDGVSLTVNRCRNDKFSVMVIPHTQLKSTFQSMRVGDDVNLEVDIIGKYVEKLHFLDSEQYSDGSAITEEFLKKHGF